MRIEGGFPETRIRIRDSGDGSRGGIRTDGFGWMGSDGWVRMDGFGWMGSDGWIRMDGFGWMDSDGWIRMDGFGWMDSDGWIRREAIEGIDARRRPRALTPARWNAREARVPNALPSPASGRGAAPHGQRAAVPGLGLRGRRTGRSSSARDAADDRSSPPPSRAAGEGGGGRAPPRHAPMSIRPIDPADAVRRRIIERRRIHRKTKAPERRSPPGPPRGLQGRLPCPKFASSQPDRNEPARVRGPFPWSAVRFLSSIKETHRPR